MNQHLRPAFDRIASEFRSRASAAARQVRAVGVHARPVAAPQGGHGHGTTAHLEGGTHTPGRSIAEAVAAGRSLASRAVVASSSRRAAIRTRVRESGLADAVRRIGPGRTAAIVVVLCLLAGSASWSMKELPAVRADVENVIDYEANIEARHSYRLPVLHGNTTYGGASEVGMGYAGYFDQTTPLVNATFTFTVGTGAALAGDVDITTELRVVAEDAEGRPYWDVRETLATSNGLVLDDDGVATQSFTVNVTELRAIVSRIENETLMRTSGAQAIAMTTVERNLTVDDHRLTGTSHHAMVLGLRQGYFTLPPADALVDEEPVSQVGTQSVLVPIGRLEAARLSPWTLAPIAIMGVILAGLVTDSVLGLRRGPEKHAATERTRRRYKAWFTTAQVPASWRDAEVIEVGSLRDLVDIAIDARTRVLEDVEAGRYFVRDDDAIHVFAPQSAEP